MEQERYIFDGTGKDKRELPIIKMIAEYNSNQLIVVLDEEGEEEVGLLDSEGDYFNDIRQFYQVETRSPKTKCYYKLVIRGHLGNFVSVIKHSSTLDYVFNHNEWKQSPKGMPFFLFDTIENAYSYYRSLNFGFNSTSLNFYILKCQAKNIREVKYVSDSFGNIPQFWKAYNKIIKTSQSKRDWDKLDKEISLSIPPKGTLVASSIKTIEIIDIKTLSLTMEKI